MRCDGEGRVDQQTKVRVTDEVLQFRVQLYAFDSRFVVLQRC
jgi:hypothetical protein